MRAPIWALRLRPAIVAVVVAVSGLAPSAQVRSLNGAGIAAAHEHLLITDEAASTAFWSAIGGQPEHIGTMAGVKFPGVYVLFQGSRGGGARGRGAVTGGAPPSNPPPAAAPSAAASPAPVAPQPPESSVGSVAEALGFKVKSLRATLTSLAALGVQPESGSTATRASVMSPEKVRVILVEDPTLSTPAASNEVVMKVPEPAAAAQWYAKWFGAKVVQQGQDVVAQLPGMNMRFVQVAQPAAGTRGRAIDHLGFEVANLQAFADALQQGGVTVNTPFRNINLGFLTAITFITDPWGTYIELNEGYVNGPR
jgi:catechol 2,3-dioxygenase-like lactoylglutathione lyase family enzyme